MTPQNNRQCKNITITITTPPTVFMTFEFLTGATAIFFRTAPTVIEIVSPVQRKKSD